MNEHRPDDRRMKFLLDRMHSSSDAFATAECLLAENADACEGSLLQEALDLKENASGMMAEAIREFLEEIRQRRHESGNYQYPFAPFEEFPNRVGGPRRSSPVETGRNRGVQS